MSIVLQSSGGGSVTLQEAVTASNLTITVPAVTGTMLTSASSVTRSQLPTGTVLQVVSATKTDNASYSLATGSLTDVSGLSVTITPTSATSKFLVIFTVHLGCSFSATSNPYVVLDRNGTNILLGDSTGSRTRASATAGFMAVSDYTLASVSQNYLDSPATTSALTYKIRVGAFASRTFFLNRTNVDNAEGNTATSSITVMEIAA
jgi:hypothetical protein